MATVFCLGQSRYTPGPIHFSHAQMCLLCRKASGIIQEQFLLFLKCIFFGVWVQEITLYPRLINSPSSCISLPCAGITCVYHHTRLRDYRYSLLRALLESLKNQVTDWAFAHFCIPFWFTCFLHSILGAIGALFCTCVLFCFYVCGYFVCMYTCAVRQCLVPVKAGIGHWIPCGVTGACGPPSKS